MKMKYTVVFCVAAALCLGGAAYAQDAQSAAAAAAQEMSKAPEAQKAEEKPNFWTSAAEFTFGLNQTSLWDWAAGGYNNLSLNSGLDANAKYEKDLMSWGNRLQLQYGTLSSADKKGLLQITTDRIYAESKWGYKTRKDSKWSYSAAFDFRSQFSDGYSNYKQGEDGLWTGTLKSGFLAPAYTNLGLGMDWAPTKWLNINIAPLTGGFTIVRIEELRKTYGMQLRDPSVTNPVGKDYRNLKFQFGAQLKIDAKFVINEVFNYGTQLVLFTDYLDNPFKEYRVNWDNKITWNVGKYFKIGLDTWLIYDPNVIIKNDKDIAQYPDGRNRIQFKEFTSFNFAYTLKPRRLRGK